jgi:NAD(P)-dependent dehydrogenase (short-subunit alcohol dehydrogenase family)
VVERFFDELLTPIDHVMVTGPGPYYAPLADFDIEKARHDVEAHLFLPLQVARDAAKKVRPDGTLLFMGGTGGRRTAPGLALISALTAAMPALTKNLALELAPIRVNLISRRASSTHRCRHRCSAINLKTGAISFAQRFLSGGS